MNIPAQHEDIIINDGVDHTNSVASDREADYLQDSAQQQANDVAGVALDPIEDDITHDGDEVASNIVEDNDTEGVEDGSVEDGV